MARLRDKENEGTQTSAQVRCIHCNAFVLVDCNLDDLFCWSCKRMATLSAERKGSILEGNLGKLALRLVVVVAEKRIMQKQALELFDRAKANPRVAAALLERAKAA